MAYRIEIKAGAHKELLALANVFRDRVIAGIDALAADPRPHGSKKLAGFFKVYRIRIGDYRVIYEIENQVLVITVIRVAHRREVYR